MASFFFCHWYIIKQSQIYNKNPKRMAIDQQQNKAQDWELKDHEAQTKPGQHRPEGKEMNQLDLIHALQP